MAMTAGTITRYFSHLQSKFVTWRINRISRSINEFKSPYQPKNNGIPASPEFWEK
jgi:hypothetical protein